MGTLNVKLINGGGRHHQQGGEKTKESEAFSAERSLAFQEHLGVKEKTIKATYKELDPEYIKKINEDFLHSSVAINSMHEAYNSASKQNAVSYQGDKVLPGSGETLMHANRELTLRSQDQILSASAEIAAS